MRAVSVGLLLEEQRGEIAVTWKRAIEVELGGEPAIGFAVGPLLREMALALRGDTPPSRPRTSENALARCAVLVRSGAQPARVAREFKLLHRALWEVIRREGRVVAPDERRAADEWLDEALAATLDRLERVRTRIDLFERGPVVVPPAKMPMAPTRPPPLRAVPRPPPLPRQRPPAPATESSERAAPIEPIEPLPAE